MGLTTTGDIKFGNGDNIGSDTEGFGRIISKSQVVLGSSGTLVLPISSTVGIGYHGILMVSSILDDSSYNTINTYSVGGINTTYFTPQLLDTKTGTGGTASFSISVSNNITITNLDPSQSNMFAIFYGHIAE